MTGTVLDESGGAVRGASITLHQPETNRSYQTTSNDSGYYAIPNIPPGIYELTVSFKGFATSIRKDLELTVGQSATIDVTLKVATAAEQVTVSTEAPFIEPSKTEISQVIGTQEINSLPISGRLFTDFALLTPGVATGRTSLQSTITEFEVTRVSFGGMRDLSNLVTVDGADNINTATGSQRSTPPQEAVAEFRVVNSSFGAEYGRALGGIVNIVTKSGTNDFHGSVYDYLQNDATDARSILQPVGTSKTLRQNQYGGTIGGPIKKDKTFIFANYEGQRRGEAPTFPTTYLEPVTLLDGTNTTNADLINRAKALLGLPPEGCNVPIGQCPALSGTAFLNSVLKTKDNDYGIVKLDHQINADNHLSLRYSVEDGRDLNQLVGSTLDGGGIGAPSSGHDVFLRDQSLVGTVATTISPNLVNSVLVQYARRHYNFPGVTGQPNLDIPNTLLFGHNFGVLDAIYESRFQISDSLSWVKGNHVAKFGVDFNYVDNFVIWPGFTPMRIVLPGINCLVDFANFVNSTSATPLPPVASAPADGPCPVANPPYFPAVPGPNENDPLQGTPIVFWGAPVGTAQPDINGQLPTPPPIPTDWKNAYLPSETKNFSETLAHKYYGLYAQDQWRLRHNLTLNYGLRWDFEQGLWKQINPHYTGFQPRVGLAWSPDSKTVIRSGFGIFDDRYNLSFLFITQPQRPVDLPGETVRGIRKRSDVATWVLNQFTPGPWWPCLSCLPALNADHYGSGSRPIHHRPLPSLLHCGRRLGRSAQPDSLLRASQPRNRSRNRTRTHRERRVYVCRRPPFGSRCKSQRLSAISLRHQRTPNHRSVYLSRQSVLHSRTCASYRGGLAGRQGIFRCVRFASRRARLQQCRLAVLHRRHRQFGLSRADDTGNSSITTHSSSDRTIPQEFQPGRQLHLLAHSRRWHLHHFRQHAAGSLQPLA